MHDQLNPQYAAIVICVKCGSNRVDVAGWVNGETARFRCAGCQHETVVHGFTIGRVSGDKAMACLPDALFDTAMPEFAQLVQSEATRRAG